MDVLACELIFEIAFCGVLRPIDIINWAMASKTVAVDLLSNNYGRDRIVALDGLDTSYEMKNKQAMKIALERFCRPSEGVDHDFLNKPIADNNIDMIRFLLEWRSPRGEFFDPRQDECEMVVDAALTSDTMFRLMLDWRGPNDEWVDVRKIMHHMTDICADRHSDGNPLQTLLDWRGPSGQWVDARRCRHQMFKEYIVQEREDNVRLLLEWRGPDGEWIDVRFLDNWCIRNACRHSSVAVIRLLLEWQGPGGEHVDVNANGGYAVKCAKLRGLRKLISSVPRYATLFS